MNNMKDARYTLVVQDTRNNQVFAEQVESSLDEHLRLNNPAFQSTTKAGQEEELADLAMAFLTPDMGDHAIVSVTLKQY